MVQHLERKKAVQLKRVREAVASRKFPLLENNLRCLTECLIILGEDANIRVMNLCKIMVESSKDNFLCMINETREQISQLERTQMLIFSI
jgi:hypothetical protein